MKENLKIESLSNEKINDMIKYFIEYNNKMAQDLKKIKKNIMSIYLVGFYYGRDNLSQRGNLFGS